MLRDFLKFFNLKMDIVYSQNFYQDYFDYLGGMQFGGGLFNAFRLEDIPKWKGYLVDAFPRLEGKILPFGYTWDGVCYCVDVRDGKIIVCDVGAGEITVIPHSMMHFLNKDIPASFGEPENILDFKEWISENGQISYGSCAGLRIPLFLDGAEENSNREISDMEVYWGVFGQIKRQIMGE